LRPHRRADSPRKESPEGKPVVGFSATGSISRSDFGLDFNVPILGGGLALGDRVELVLEIEATLNEEAS
jgi:polyisoprenoid-binding protein YceI